MFGHRQQDLRCVPPRRAPAAVVAGSLAVGILLDRFAGGACSVPVWAGVGVAAALISLVTARSRWSVIMVIGALISLGAGWHHAWVFTRGADDVARYARREPELAVLQGTVAGSPVLRPADETVRVPWPDYDRTAIDVDCRLIGAGEDAIGVSGCVRVFVSGHTPHVEVGDAVRVLGWLALPSPPSNPGDFDYRTVLAREGVSCISWTGRPEAVKRLERGPSYGVRRMLQRLRSRLVAVLFDVLEEREAGVAAAVLLGDRAWVGDDVRASFAESGTLHLLAISGLHVGLWAAFAWGFCWLFGFGDRTMAVTVIVSVIAYAALVGGRPSVVRATVFVTVWTIAWVRYRAISLTQLLGVAATGLLTWNPLQLFDTGAQLSFLAVAGIAIWQRWLRGSAAARESNPRDLVERGAWWRWLGNQWGRVQAALGLVVAIWIVTSPLVASRFHLVSPVGLFANVVLMAVVAGVMWTGFAFSFLALVWPDAAAEVAWLFEMPLGFVLDAVAGLAAWRHGHLYGVGPAGWWCAGWYVLVAVTGVWATRPRARWRCVTLMLAWVTAGLAASVTTTVTGPAEVGLRCTFLDVGHGNAVLVELPNGRTLLFDGGSLSDPGRAERTICRAVWSRGRSRLDAVVVSHADADHFNAIARVAERVPIGTLFVARSFLDFEQPLVAKLFDDLDDVDVRLIRRGDALRLDEAVEIEVLHPEDGVAYDSDNAASVVLAITSFGRRVLLTGDVERDGLDVLLSRSIEPVDVLASPHHGSPAANPEELFAWAGAEHVVVSGGRRAPIARVAERAVPARVWSTGRDGAVTVTVTPNGDLDVSPTVPTPPVVERFSDETLSVRRSGR